MRPRTPSRRLGRVKETIEAHRRLLQALVALLLPAAMSFGCATLGVVPEIGRRTDRISRFERVLREDERLVLFYRIDTHMVGARRASSQYPMAIAFDVATAPVQLWYLLFARWSC